jgi:choice-of-anchor C domain-containing protein
MRVVVIALAMPAILLMGLATRSEGEKLSASLDENLLVNGSFEEGLDVDRFLPLDIGSDAMKGWVVTRGQIDLVGPQHWKAADGKHALDLHGSPGFGGVKQTFKTVEGRRYRVSFSMAGSPGSGSSVNTLCVRAANKKEVFSFDTEGKTPGDMGWTTKTWEFVAVGDETTLEIHTLDDEIDVAGPALDNVQVVAVADKK